MNTVSIVLLWFVSLYFCPVNSYECFTCVSAADWNYFNARIPGLIHDANNPPPLAPLSCVFDPLKAYADRSISQCSGKCYKWTSATIQADGSISVYVLRGCFDKLINSTLHSPPSDDRCYQSPSHYSHEPGVEYVTECFCHGFMCNSSTSKKIFSAITLLITIYLIK